MTVRLEFHREKPAGKEAHRPFIPGLAKVFFTGLAVIPLMFTSARGTAATSPGWQAPPMAAAAPLLDIASVRNADSGKRTVEQFMQSYTGPKTERILDTNVDVDTPDSSLRQMAAAYKAVESRSGKVHTCVLTDESDTFSVITDLPKGTMRVSLKFKKENDRYKVPVPGTRSFDADGFVRLVRRLPGGKSWAATRIFLDKISGTDIKSVIFLPMDSRGRAVTAVGNGSYLAYTLIYYAGCITEVKPTVIHDKGDVYSIPVAGEKK